MIFFFFLNFSGLIFSENTKEVTLMFIASIAPMSSTS